MTRIQYFLLAAAGTAPFLFASNAGAVVLASDDFTANSGGAGFEAANVWENHDIVDGLLNTDFGTGFRNFNVTGEPGGSTGPGLDAQSLSSIYIRFDMADNSGSDTAWGGLAFFEGVEGSAGAETLFIGNAGNNASNQFAIDLKGPGVLFSGEAIDDTDFHTLIVGINFNVSGADDEYNIWVDNFDLFNPNATQTAAGPIDAAWGTLRVAGDAGDAFRVDNLTIGTDFNDVGLIPEPSALGLLAFAAAGGLVFRRRRSR